MSSLNAAVDAGAELVVTVGQAVDRTVSTSGFSTAPTLACYGLPAGLTFTDNGDGTGTISGAPIDAVQGATVQVLAYGSALSAVEHGTELLTDASKRALVGVQGDPTDSRLFTQVDLTSAGPTTLAAALATVGETAADGDTLTNYRFFCGDDSVVGGGFALEVEQESITFRNCHFHTGLASDHQYSGTYASNALYGVWAHPTTGPTNKPAMVNCTVTGVPDSYVEGVFDMPGVADIGVREFSRIERCLISYYGDGWRIPGGGFVARENIVRDLIRDAEAFGDGKHPDGFQLVTGQDDLTIERNLVQGPFQASNSACIIQLRGSGTHTGWQWRGNAFFGGGWSMELKLLEGASLQGAVFHDNVWVRADEDGTPNMDGAVGSWTHGILSSGEEGTGSFIDCTWTNNRQSNGTAVNWAFAT